MNEIDLKNALALTASICTILQFLTGVIVCRKFVTNKSTGDNSPFPFVSGCLSTSLWLRYGILIKDHSIVLVNIVGVTLFLTYVIVFYLYTIKKTILVRQILVCFMFLTFILTYLQRLENGEHAKETLGFVCCIVTILFFAAPLANLIHVVKAKNTDSLPYPLIVATLVVSLQWFIYGLILDDTFIQIPNFLGCLLSGFQLSLFVIYPNKKNLNQNSII